MNLPQLEAQLIDAEDQVHIMGRGLGKSEKIIAFRSYKQMQSMPRCGIAMLGASYMQIMDRTLPPILKEWKDWGLKKDVDYWVRRMPPSEYSSVMPYWSPETAEHALFLRTWYKSSGRWKFTIEVSHLIGQDRAGSSNSKSIDGIVGDEAKLLKWDRVENETALANRGNEKYFKHSPWHHGVCYTTDMPAEKTVLDKLLNYEKAAITEDNMHTLELIKGLQYEIYLERNKSQPDSDKLAEYELMLYQLRKYTTHFSEASTLMNSEVLGMEFIRKLKRTLPDFIFRLSVLNIRPNAVEHGFYPDLFDSHFTYANDYSVIDCYDPESSERPKDCRKDSDIIKNKPLIISPDWGARIITLCIAQLQLTELRILNELYVLHPDSLAELAKKFHDYYKYLPHRDIILVYDQTGTGIYPGSKLSNVDQFTDALEVFGWKVLREYIGDTPEPMARYTLGRYCLRGGHPDYIDVSFNAENTQFLKTSMQLAGIDDKNPKGWRKDKSMERNKDADQREAPHFSDAFDNLLWFANQTEITSGNFTSFGFI